MAKVRIDLNRYKKIYPLMRKSPSYFTGGIDEVESVVLDFSNSNPATKELTNKYTTPVVVATAVDENINVWVSNIAIDPDGTTTIQVSVSDASFTGEVHVHVAEAS